MESQTILNGVFVVGVAVLSHRITNAIAIWMLFNPHDPIKIGPWRLQGALPKNKARLAKAIGKTVGDKLLTPEDLAERLSAAPIREAFARALQGGIGRFLREDRGPLIDLLTPEVRARLEAALDELARRGGDALITYAQSPAFEARVAGLLPLVYATGPGAIGNRTIGTAAVGGMLVGTLIGVLVIPGLYYIFGIIAEKRKLLQDEADAPLSEVFEHPA
jgi:hypothetical protein